jgi:hypothetical protein
MSIFEQLRALDDLDELRALRFADTRLPLWPFVRWILASAIQEQALGQQSAFSPTAPRRLTTTAAIVARAALNGPLVGRKRFDVVIKSSSAGLVAKRGERWLDRIVDYFALERPDDTLVLDTAQSDGYRTPRVPPHVRSFDTFDFIAAAASRLRRPRADDVVAVESLLALVQRNAPLAPSPSTIEHVRTTLVYQSLRLSTLRRLYARFFRRTQPRVLLVEDGSYGAFAHVMTWARDAGIATAEPQHGVIARSHLAYNYGERAIADATFARCLPEYLLVYGEIWRAETRTPSSVVVVGCPHFTETAGTSTCAHRHVVIVSQGICTERMVELTTAVARANPTLRCVFRLHPGEVAMRDRYASLATIPNVEISERGDIYPLLRDARAVIGHSSTALVEAAGIGVPVLVADDEGSRAILPPSVGTWFRTTDELLTLVASPPSVAIEPSQFFAPDWRERYRSFILARS